ncbi:hypothetical protein NDU88_003728 [Pleurodeles waltl]|uniref:Uncharacterized protein n=1 Tax=Pleurodeles waltl TaxID=8319 RepID=A0AAV7TPB7_PLEWA|nr:hypothetical protein NDU88_003728 [Pleurodeles waltl]
MNNPPSPSRYPSLTHSQGGRSKALLIPVTPFARHEVSLPVAPGREQILPQRHYLSAGATALNEVRQFLKPMPPGRVGRSLKGDRSIPAHPPGCRCSGSVSAPGTCLIT